MLEVNSQKKSKCLTRPTPPQMGNVFTRACSQIFFYRTFCSEFKNTCTYNIENKSIQEYIHACTGKDVVIMVLIAAGEKIESPQSAPRCARNCTRNLFISHANTLEGSLFKIIVYLLPRDLRVSKTLWIMSLTIDLVTSVKRMNTMNNK